MNNAQLRQEIKQVQKRIGESKSLMNSALMDLSSQEIEPPYCYWLPLCAFVLGYRFAAPLSQAALLLSRHMILDASLGRMKEG